MPTITFGDMVIDCKRGENLRRVLLKAKLPLYNGLSKAIHCRGLGTCGTCAVEIDGQTSPPTAVEKWRLSFPPHVPESDLRLACQCSVEGNLRVVKHGGMWGQHKKPTADEDQSKSDKTQDPS